MNTCKCDICGKDFLSPESSEQFVVCDECKAALGSDREDLGGDDYGNP